VLLVSLRWERPDFKISGCRQSAGRAAPFEALSVIYREKMRLALTTAGLGQGVAASVWQSDWVVHSKAVGDGQHCLEYLAR